MKYSIAIVTLLLALGNAAYLKDGGILSSLLRRDVETSGCSCQRLGDALWEMFSSLEEIVPEDAFAEVAAEVQSKNGIDIRNKAQVKREACLAAGVSSLEELAELEGMSVEEFTPLYAQMKQQLAGIEQQMAQLEASGMDLPPTYQRAITAMTNLLAALRETQLLDLH